MRAVNAAAQAQREKRTAVAERTLLFATARSFATAAEESMGLWTGAEPTDFTFADLWNNGTARTATFHGAGGVLAVAPAAHEAGLNVGQWTVTLAQGADAVNAAIRGYDMRGAKVQLHVASFDPESGLLLGVEPWFAGFANGNPITRPVPGGEGRVELKVVSLKRVLTLTPGRKKSDASLRLRAPNDSFRKYKAVAGQVEIVWGQKRVRADATKG